MKDWERFKRLFPHLAKEMEEGSSKLQIDQFRKSHENSEDQAMRKWEGYNPDVIDFVQRCNTKEEAEDIISYLELKGKLSPKRAAEIRSQLRDEGLRSFGKKKDRDFYHKEI